MQKLLLTFLIVSSLVCCTSNQATNRSSVKDSATTIYFDSITPLLLCYAYINNGDTIKLKITNPNNADTFIGQLLYQLKEKDRNKGNLQGTVKGDTLIANYSFFSEGKLSVRQVAFLKQGNNLREGFGEVKEENGNMIFTNPQALQFTSFLLTPAACE